MSAINKLIDADGKVQLGIFEESVDWVNYRDFDLRTPMGGHAGPLKRWFGFNQFQYFGLISDQLILGCALANTKLASVAFLYLYRPDTREMNEYTFRMPLSVGVRMSQCPDNGRSNFRFGKNRIDMINTPAPNEKRLLVMLKDGTEVDLRFTDDPGQFDPMRICTRAGYTGWVYAQKVAGVPARGTVRSRLGEFDLEAINGCAHHDWSAGYMRRETWWNWACFSGMGKNGECFGLNVSCGVNETGFTENCFWLDGTLHKIDTLKFDYDIDDLDKPWRITSFDGKLDLLFHPEGEHSEKINLLMMASNFKQLFGKFEGQVRIDGGHVIEISEQYGFVEDHYAKW